jgi:hypothetical protein
MEHKTLSIRPFIGAKDYELSRSFYRDLGFQESVLDRTMSYFKTGQFGFYLQDFYVRDWIDNSMIFMEVDDWGVIGTNCWLWIWFSDIKM